MKGGFVMIRKPGKFDEMFDLFQNFDRFFGRPMWQARELPGETSDYRRALPLAPMRAAFYPSVECFTKDKQLVLRAELPGVDPKDIDVTIAGNQLLLRGEKKEDYKIDEKDLFFQEVSRGRFERTFALPEGVKMDQVKASFNNGVLELTMPSGMIDQARKVPIEIGAGKFVKAA
jgi:HSP20 family protein